MSMNAIRFAKMHGLGNDFMVIDTLQQAYTPDSHRIAAWADRHTGIGFDQLLLITPSSDPSIDFGYRIFNADGSEVQQCGNGARCVARYVQQRGYTNKSQLRVATVAGVLELTCLADQQIQVNMGIPQFTPASLPFNVSQQQERYQLDIDEESVDFGAVSMGNPHIVLPVPNVAIAAVNELGTVLAEHALFPESVNVGFMQVVDHKTIKLRVYERGVGETLACGSGACAAMVIAHMWQLVDDTVQVELSGGVLRIEWAGPNTPVYMTGAATWVFDGEITA